MVVWKCTLEGAGALCVIMALPLQLPMWHVFSWDSPVPVTGKIRGKFIRIINNGEKNVFHFCYSINSYFAPSAPPSTEILLDGVNCTNDGLTLLSCGHKSIGVHSCTHAQDVALTCQTRTPTPPYQCEPITYTFMTPTVTVQIYSISVSS